MKREKRMTEVIRNEEIEGKRNAKRLSGAGLAGRRGANFPNVQVGVSPYRYCLNIFTTRVVYVYSYVLLS